MKLREVFRYELTYRLRSVSTWLYAGFLFLAAMWTFLATAEGDIYVNAPVRLAAGAAITGMIGLLVSAAIFGDAAVRDFAADMDQLLFTSSIRKIDYLGGRFLAAFTVNAIVMVAIPLGHLVATTMVTAVQSAKVGPFRILAFAQPWALFVAPNLILAGAILYTIGVLARRLIPVYLGAIALFITYLVAANAAEQITNPILSLLSDPIGLHTLQLSARYWTEAEQNVRLVGFPAMLVVNRVVWLAAAVAVLVLLYRRFRFVPAGVTGRRRRTTRLIGEVATSRARAVEVPRVAGTFDFRMTVRQASEVARHSLMEVLRSRWFMGVLFACTGLTMLMGWNVAHTVFETSTWPVTLLVAGTVLAQRVSPIVYLLIALYTGELVWKNRDVKVDEIMDAAPVPESVALIGRFAALVAMIVMFQAALMAGGILIQVLQGYYHLEIALYLEVLGMKLVDYVLFAALAMTFQVVVNHKYLGYMVLLLAFLATVLLPMLAQLSPHLWILGIFDHHLLRYDSDPGWIYSDMNGFGPFIRPWAWFKLYWAAWASLLLVIAALFWVRGREPDARHRAALARARFAGAARGVAAAAVVSILLLGGFIFYNTNVLNDYQLPTDVGRPQANYERRYKRFENTPQPTLTDAKLQIEIYPTTPAVDLRGTYRLLNTTSAPIDSVHVMFIDPAIDARSITFDRAYTPVVVDDETRYRIFAFERPLAPGDSVQLVFDVSFRPRGFPNSGVQTKVASDRAIFDRSWLPMIGYQPMHELSDLDARERFRLPPRPPAPRADDMKARQYRWPIRNEDLVHLDAVVSTPAGQIAIMPGMLRRSWMEKGRRYFHYETKPTLFGGNVISGKYAVLGDHWKDSSSGSARAVALRILHTHDSNLDRTLRSMKASLAYDTEEFSPYPYGELSIVEIPRYGGFGRALAHTITFTEDYFLSRVREGEVDQPFYGTSHEIAHQWWGGLVRGAAVRGQEFLSESLANYTAMLVTEQTYGPETGRRVYDFQMDRYLRGRANFSREVPLLDVGDQPYIAYRKGAIAMYTLRSMIGEDRVNSALRRYLETYRDAGPPYPTSRDLYAELRAVTPDSLQYLLTDLFETVTLWDVGTTRAVVEPTGTGAYRVTLDVTAKKLRADSIGKETEVPMNDLVEVGVFARGGGGRGGAPLYLKRQRIHSGQQTISVIVSREPARAGIDPYHVLIDRRREDNVVDVARSSGSGQ